VLRLMGLVYSLCNLTSAFAIRKKIREFQPDVIWLHSVSRFLGPVVIREVVKWGENKKVYTNLEISQKRSNLNEKRVPE